VAIADLEQREVDTSADPLWYKDAVIYQLNVKGLLRLRRDGMGDFKGVTQKLDYIKELGVNTIWLMPFYPSPLRDDGYDISSYDDVHPQYGTLTTSARCWPRRTARSAGHHRAGDQPYFRRPPVVPGRAQGAGRLARARLLRLERQRPEVPRHTHHLHRHRDLELDLGPGGQGLLLAPLLQPPARPELRQPAGARGVFKTMRFWLDMGSTASGSTRFPTCRARRHQLREPARRRTR
jgi:maltose alpha-D-glucosyltransferase/alpha-amylase